MEDREVLEKIVEKFGGVEWSELTTLEKGIARLLIDSNLAWIVKTKGFPGEKYLERRPV